MLLNLFLNLWFQVRAGHIINVGSIAAKEAYPKGNVYCATKAAVDKFTEGLRIDLNEYNIKKLEQFTQD